MQKFVPICSTLLLSSLAATVAFSQTPSASPPIAPSVSLAPAASGAKNASLDPNEQKYNDAANLFTRATLDYSAAQSSGKSLDQANTEIAAAIVQLQAVEPIPHFQTSPDKAKDIQTNLEIHRDIHNGLGYLYLLQNTPESIQKAIPELETVVKLNPNDMAARQNLGDAYRNADPPRYSDAAVQYQYISAAQPLPATLDKDVSASAEVKLDEATALGQAGSLDESLAEFQELDNWLQPKLSSLETDDTLKNNRAYAATVYKNYGFYLKKAGKDPQAAGALHTAATLNPSDADAWLDAGELYAQQGSSDEAIPDLTKAIGPDVNPQLDTVRQYDAHFALAQAHIAKNETNQAINEYDAASQLEPQNAVPFYNKGVLQEQLHLSADAAASYRSALNIDSGDLQTQTALGMLLAQQKNYAESATLLAQAAPRLPQEQPADRQKAAIVYATLGDMQAMQKDQAGANQSRLQALALNPDDVTTRLKMADMYLAQNQYVTALVQYDLAAKARPEDPSIQNQRGVIYKNTGQYHNALIAFNRALTLMAADDVRRAEVLNNIGVVDELSKKPAEAMVAYRRALQINPKQSEARQNLNNLVSSLTGH